MMRNRAKFPPGGWQYVQSVTNWAPPSNLSLASVAQRVQQHRMNHPELGASTNLSDIADEIDMYNCERIGWDETWCDTQKKTIPRASSDSHAKPEKSGIKQGVQAVVRHVAESVKGMVRGGAAFVEWLGEGQTPVSRAQAIERAETCLKCPKNVTGWNFRTSVAMAIKRHTEAKKQLSLSLPQDSKLHTCSACECPLQLKVWVPLAHILNHTPESIEKDLHADCWITAEKKRSQSVFQSELMIPSGHFHSSD